MDFIKGGRGKKAPYDTEMYRIPSAIKETVQQLAIAWKQAYLSGDPIISPSHLLNKVQTAIVTTAHPHVPTNLISSIEDKCTITDDAVERLEAVRELVSKWKGNSKDTRNWVEANKLLKELEIALLLKNE